MLFVIVRILDDGHVRREAEGSILAKRRTNEKGLLLFPSLLSQGFERVEQGRRTIMMLTMTHSQAHVCFKKGRHPQRTELIFCRCRYSSNFILYSS